MILGFGSNEMIILNTVLPVIVVFLVIVYIIRNTGNQKRKIKELEDKINESSKKQE